ncbi:MAG: response regulator transcription factor [Bifidobacteriaceae bacterium]|nr:response regulator transcription factor [Bifidobacteriaceae bacterium]
MQIVLAEDHVLLREGLVRLLTEAGHEVVATAGTAPELVERVEDGIRAGLDLLVVTDVRMPPGMSDDGLRAAVRLRRAHPGLGVLVLSQYVEESYARDLLAGGTGGTGYLLKDRIQDLAELQDAVIRIAAGGTVIDPEVIAQLMVRSAASPLDRLTAREREVLELMAQGRANAAIGRELVVTSGAVEKHISSIFAKLDLAPSPDDHRRVLAVIAWLAGRGRGRAS